MAYVCVWRAPELRTHVVIGVLLLAAAVMPVRDAKPLYYGSRPQPASRSHCTLADSSPNPLAFKIANEYYTVVVCPNPKIGQMADSLTGTKSASMDDVPAPMRQHAPDTAGERSRSAGSDERSRSPKDPPAEHRAPHKQSSDQYWERLISKEGKRRPAGCRQHDDALNASSRTSETVDRAAQRERGNAEEQEQEALIAKRLDGVAAEQRSSNDGAAANDCVTGAEGESDASAGDARVGASLDGESKTSGKSSEVGSKRYSADASMSPASDYIASAGKHELPQLDARYDASLPAGGMCAEGLVQLNGVCLGYAAIGDSGADSMCRSKWQWFNNSCVPVSRSMKAPVGDTTMECNDKKQRNINGHCLRRGPVIPNHNCLFGFGNAEGICLGSNALGPYAKECQTDLIMVNDLCYGYMGPADVWPDLDCASGFRIRDMSCLPAGILPTSRACPSYQMYLAGHCFGLGTTTALKSFANCPSKWSDAYGVCVDAAALPLEATSS